jgi:hypothetical protein
MGALPIFMVNIAWNCRPTFEVPAAHDKSSQGWEALVFSKSRYLRGLKSGGGSSDGEHPGYPQPMSTTAVSPKPAANDADATGQAADKPSRSWPFAYALGLALLGSVILWAIIAAVIHYA